jgi:glucose/mannose-6-phosphate isomerase
MMKNAILNFSKQFEYSPVIEGGKLKKLKKFTLIGMGGSHLNGDMVLAHKPDFPLIVRRDYGLPKTDERSLRESLIICSSYSGNTEEVLEAFAQARKKGLSIVCIAVGGKLIELAKKYGVPYIQMPDTGIQPRSALGYSFHALLKVLGEEESLITTAKLAKSIDSKKLEKVGKNLAKKLKDKVPVIYSSTPNETLAWNWKIKLNETGKIPAFYNVFPELNHNEMTGFDVQDTSRHLSDKFSFILLRDTKDHKKVQKRMDVLEKLYHDRGLPVTNIGLTGRNFFEKMFNSLVLADWTALYTAELYGLESEQVPMVEEFKKMV